MDTRIDRDCVADRPASRTGIGPPLTFFALDALVPGAPLVVILSTLHDRGESRLWLAAAAVARLLPYLLCSPLAGALASRVEPRRLFARLALTRAAVAVSIGVAVAAEADPGILVVLMALLVAIGCPSYPALMRVIRDHSSTARLDRTTALAAGLESAAFWAGPAVGGLLLFAGSTNAIVVSTAMALVSAAVARTVPAMRSPAPCVRPTAALRESAAQMLVPSVRPAIAAVLGLNVLGGFLAVLLVRLPSELDFGDRREFGLLSLAQGIGAVSIFAAMIGPLRPGRRPFAPLLAAAIALVVMATGQFVATAAACVAFGAAVLAGEAAASNVLCRGVPVSLVAASFGLLDAGMVAAMVAGSLAAPLADAAFGMRASIALVTSATVVACFAATRLVPMPTEPPRRHSAMPEEAR